MNQEKIGKFIRELRKEKNMTQQELAIKVGVSDKSISKWETGRCLMDLSLIKPVCQILDITVLELLNGERIETDDVNDISNETLEKTLIFTKSEVKRGKRRTTIIMACLFLTILASIYLIYQSYNLVKYSTDIRLNEYMEENIEDNLTQKDKVTIYKKTIPEEEYITINNIKFKNYIRDLILEERTYDYYYRAGYYDNEEWKTIFQHFKYNTFIPNGTIGSFSNHLNITETVDLKEYTLKNDINDDIELIEHFKENGYRYNNLFTSVEEMRFNQAYNELRFYFAYHLSDEGYTLIDGDYRAIYIEFPYTSSDKTITEKIVYIFKNESAYTMYFRDERFTKEVVLDLISTLEIR